MNRVAIAAALCAVPWLGCGSSAKSDAQAAGPSSAAGTGGSTGGSGGNGGSSNAGTTNVTIGSGSGGGGGNGDPCTQLIDFETVPGSAPGDGKAIGAEFQDLYGVSFGLDKDDDGKPDPGALPVMAKVGNPATAFVHDKTGVGDEGEPGQKIGSYFLTDDGVVAGPPAPLVISYTTAVADAYGQIIDIDGSEGWTIESRAANGMVLGSVVIKAGDAGTGDGIATPFSFHHPSADIRSIRLRYTGAASGGVGLAFDNFSPACDMPTIK